MPLGQPVPKLSTLEIALEILLKPGTKQPRPGIEPFGTIVAGPKMSKIKDLASHTTEHTL